MGLSLTTTMDIRCVLIGDSGVGKTTLVNLWCLKPPPPTYVSTKGVTRHDLHFKARIHAKCPKKRSIHLIVYDVGGDVADPTMEKYVKSADVIVMLYDVTKVNTLDTLDYWWQSLRNLGKKRALYALVGIRNDNHTDDRKSRGGIKLMNRQEEKLDPECANVTSFQEERSESARCLCYQILKKAYACRQGQDSYLCDFAFDEAKIEAGQNSVEDNDENVTIKTFRHQTVCRKR